MLFYYFKSKKELFHYLINYSVDFITNEYLNQIDIDERDFIERHKKAALAKFKAMTKNLYVFNFMVALFLRDEVELPEQLAARVTEARKQSYMKLFNNFDTSLFREDLLPDMVIKLLRWTMTGYAEELNSRYKVENLASTDIEAAMQEFDEYLAVLKQVYYK